MHASEREQLKLRAQQLRDTAKALTCLEKYLASPGAHIKHQAHFEAMLDQLNAAGDGMGAAVAQLGHVVLKK